MLFTDPDAPGSPLSGSLTNQSFAADGKIRSLAALTSKQWEDLVDWLTSNSYTCPPLAPSPCVCGTSLNPKRQS